MPSPHKIEGVYLKHQKNKPTTGQYIKALAAIHGKDVLPDIILPKSPRPYKPRPNARHPHRHLEKDLQRAIIHYLRIHGCICGKVNASAGVFNNIRLKSNLLFVGVPDILCFHPIGGQTWIEVKTETGILSDEQLKFQCLCDDAHQKYILARSLKDVERIVK